MPPNAAPHLLPHAEVAQQWQSPHEGLGAAQVQARLQQYGPNQLQSKGGRSVLALLLGQLKDVMIVILAIAAAISLAIGEANDALVIVIIVALNTFIGFLQEYRAEKAVEALKKMSAPLATVRRGGHVAQVPAAELVPGDRVLLEAGMLVPADMRITETHLLRIAEASLTGESEAVEKQVQPLPDALLPLGDRLNMAYKSTLVSYGRGEGVVVATGMNTEIGRIAQLLQSEPSRTPLQKRLADFGKKLSLVVLAICAVIYLTGMLRGENAANMLLTAISVAVAAIPEALPALITIALALGARRMVGIKALVRQLPAVETLGSVTYICSDKTGTITQNKMTVVDTWLAPASALGHTLPLSPPEMLLLAIELNHDVHRNAEGQLQGDPTEMALVEYARQQQAYRPEWAHSFIRSHELPFDANRKRMTVVCPFQNQWLVITKGALENVLEVCQPQEANVIQAQAAQLAQAGKRVLAFAVNLLDKPPAVLSVQEIERELHFLGLVAMIDPPRPEAAKAIADCHAAGITPVMITGDHPLTARAIAQQTGILKHAHDAVMTGAELAQLAPDELVRQVERIKVYARVSPEQKLQIVEALQQKGHFVAMTGDGVNDAPALKRANIGVAMGITGTDVSKEAAHMILLDDNFATILGAVREGRRIFDNVRKFIKYLLSSNSGEVWTVFLAPLLGLPMPLLPIHILWINLATDSLPALAFAAEPAEANILQRPPRKATESIFAGGMGLYMVLVGLLMAAVCLLTQALAIRAGDTHWQSMVFTVLCVSQLWNALAIRSDRQSLFTQGLRSNLQMLGAVLLVLAVQVAVLYVPWLQTLLKLQPLTAKELLLCLALSSTVFWVVEVQKWISRRLAR